MTVTGAEDTIVEGPLEPTTRIAVVAEAPETFTPDSLAVSLDPPDRETPMTWGDPVPFTVIRPAEVRDTGPVPPESTTPVGAPPVTVVAPPFADKRTRLLCPDARRDEQVAPLVKYRLDWIGFRKRRAVRFI